WKDQPTEFGPKLGGPMSTATSLEQPTLNAADRCDRCGAQAYVRAVLPSGGQLYFCAHHARQVEDNLRPQASVWQDETNRLEEERSTSLLVVVCGNPLADSNAAKQLRQFYLLGRFPR